MRKLWTRGFVLLKLSCFLDMIIGFRAWWFYQLCPILFVELFNINFLKNVTVSSLIIIIHNLYSLLMIYSEIIFPSWFFWLLGYLTIYNYRYPSDFIHFMASLGNKNLLFCFCPKEGVVIFIIWINQPKYSTIKWEFFFFFLFSYFFSLFLGQKLVTFRVLFVGKKYIIYHDFLKNYYLSF